MFGLRWWKRSPRLGSVQRPARPRLEALEGRWAPAVLTVTTAADSGPGSLRQAILDANASPGFDTIDFAVGSGPQTIAPSSPLPNLTDAAVLDGTSQPGWAGAPLITLDGGGAGNGHGLVLLADGCGVWGLTLTHFAGCGVLSFSSFDSVQGDYLLGNGLDGVNLARPADAVHGSGVGGNLISGNARFGVWSAADGCVIQGNRIGTDAAGTAAVPNQLDGVILYGGFGSRSPVNDTVALNLISGNRISGVHLTGQASNVVQGNRIGTDAAGAAALPNGFDGVTLDGEGYTVGGTAAGQGNLISGNGRFGVFAVGHNTIAGNQVGTNAAGTAAVPNARAGVVSLGDRNVIAANLISGNGGDGVLVQHADGNTIQGNRIGTDAAGRAALPNAGNGVTLANCLATTVQGNLISGNAGVGVLTGGTDLQRFTVPPQFFGGATIRTNRIGTDAAGSAALGNGHGGVVIYLGSNTNAVGGTAAGDANVIAFNGGDGVQVQPWSGEQPPGSNHFAQLDVANAIEGNSIHDNAGLGINLVSFSDNSFGVTPNNSPPNDAGNNSQNYPVLTAVAAGANGGTDVTLTLDSTPSTSFRVEVFANAAPDPSGFGEGQTFLGAATVGTDAGGHFAGTVHVPGVVPAGQKVAATATDPAGNTSEFSADFPPPQGPV